MTTTRPKFPLHDISPDTDAATLAEWEREWDEAMEDREVRGPLHFSFAQDRDCGFMVIECTDGDSRTALLHGQIDVDQFEAPFLCEGYGLTPDDLRNNPFEHVPDFMLQGANDEHVLAWSSRPNVTTMDVTALCHDPAEDSEPLDTLTDEDREEAMAVMEQQREWLTAAAEQAAVLTDACLVNLPVALEVLQLRDTSFTDEALARAIAPMTALESFGVGSDRLTGQFLSALAGREELGDLAVSSDALTGTHVMAHLPTLPAVESMLLAGPKLLEGLDIVELATRVPALEELSINPETLADEDLYKIALALPGVIINGMQMSDKAIRRAAEKAGIQL